MQVTVWSSLLLLSMCVMHLNTVWANSFETSDMVRRMHAKRHKFAPHLDGQSLSRRSSSSSGEGSGVGGNSGSSAGGGGGGKDLGKDVASAIGTGIKKAASISVPGNRASLGQKVFTAVSGQAKPPAPRPAQLNALMQAQQAKMNPKPPAKQDPSKGKSQGS